MKNLYKIVTIPMCLLFLFDAGRSFFAYERVEQTYVFLGFAAWLIIPVAILRVVGAVIILFFSRRSLRLTEWAYTWLFFISIFSTSAHIVAKDIVNAWVPGFSLALTLCSMIISWLQIGKERKEKKEGIGEYEYEFKNGEKDDTDDK